MVDLAIPGLGDAVLIGRGGFSKVYRARQTDFDRDVAVKVLDIDVETDAARRAFTRECELAGRLTDHPNVVTVFDSDFVEATGEPYIIMGFASGGSLAAAIDERDHLPVAEALDIAIQVAGALESAHRHGVVHRDVKPQNIVFQRSGHPALTDFGIAAVAGYAATSMSAQALTPLHAAPELFRGEPSTPSSDVYGLGSTIFTMLEGHPPFGHLGDLPMAVLVKVLSDDPPKVTTQKVPARLDAVIASMLAKDPENRPRLTEVIDELRFIQQGLGEPTTNAVLLDGNPEHVLHPFDHESPSAAASSWRRHPNNRQKILIGSVAALLIAVGAVVGVILTRDSGPTYVAPVHGTGVAQLALADEHGCALMLDGTVECWGNTVEGQLGSGSLSGSFTPVKVKGLTNVTQLAVKATHSCAVLTNGELWCWGINEDGELGTGTTSEAEATPVKSLLDQVKMVSISEYATCALRVDGTVWCWGGAADSFLGQRIDQKNQLQPIQIPGLTDVVRITGGNYHSCALKSSGSVECWGNNLKGQLGQGRNSTQEQKGDPAAPVVGLDDVVSVSLGFFHSCAVLRDTTVSCWGLNASGQLGNGTTKDSSKPIKVPGLTGVSQLALGEDHSCALLTNEQIKCWGSDEFDQLGHTDEKSSRSPADADLVAPATRIGAGNSFSCAGSTSHLQCWGNNAAGQLGQGNADRVHKPVNVRLSQSAGS